MMLTHCGFEHITAGASHKSAMTTSSFETPLSIGEILLLTTGEERWK